MTLLEPESVLSRLRRRTGGEVNIPVRDLDAEALLERVDALRGRGG